MPRRLGALVVAALLLLPACAPTSGVSPSGSSRGSGLVVVTAGGTALVDGQADVPPTLDLRISAGRALAPGDVSARLDRRALALSAAGDGLSATVPPMPLGSSHSLDVDVAGRGSEHLGFRVVPPDGAMAAVHADSRDGTVLDLAFAVAPDHHAVEAALPPGGSARWVDDRHLRAAWRVAPGATLTLPATLPAARGSHLAGDLSVSLSAVSDGALRSAVVPPPGDPPSSPLVVAFTVGTAASRRSLETHAAQISLASPTGVEIGSDGTLEGVPDSYAIRIAAGAGMPLWPLVQNDASDHSGIAAILEDADAVKRLVASARRMCRRGDFPGLHLDIEGVPAGDRDRLTAAIRQLAAGLHADGRRLAVAVVPHKPNHLNVYSAAYDLRAISAVADLLTLMAYDEHTSLTEPGSVAGYGWDREVLSGSVPELQPSSTLLGLPLYARTWEHGGVHADSYAASLASALSDAGARVDYDFGARTPFIHGADGSALTYFDDAASLAAKLALVPSRRLAGIAVWRLGFEDPALWDALPAKAPRI